MSEACRPMHVLLITFNYPQITEGYIDAEIALLCARGMRVMVWSQTAAPAPGRVPLDVELAVAVSLDPLVARFKPDVIHLHWMLWEANVLDFLGRYNKPITVRVHTDTSTERLQRYATHPAVSRIYGYPGDGQRFNFDHTKFAEQPIAVTRPARQTVAKNRRLVLRAASENPRDQTLMVALARRCPDFEFVLCIGESLHNDARETRPALAAALGSDPPLNLRILWNQSSETMATWFAEAAIYLHTCLPQKTAAMPISIGQALTHGCYTLVRNQPRLMAMVNEVGGVYSDEVTAATLLQQTQSWRAADWAKKADESRVLGERFCADRALLPMLNDWQQLIAQRPI
jgi:hypothetical protein